MKRAYRIWAYVIYYVITLSPLAIGIIKAVKMPDQAGTALGTGIFFTAILSLSIRTMYKLLLKGGAIREQ